MKIGLLICRDGPSGIWAPSSEASAILAAGEINAAGGIFGQPVDLVVRDVGMTDRDAADATSTLVDIEEVKALVAMHPSSIRNAVARVAAGRVPHIYTPQYEGGCVGRDTIAIGGTDEALLRPALAWLAEARKTARFFLVGSDYVWPRTTHLTAARLIGSSGGAVVGAAILPFGTEDYGELLLSIKRARPDVVLLSLLGPEAVRFNRAFVDAGLAPHVIRLALAQDETVLYATGPDNTENLFVAAHYLSNIRSRGNDHFLELYHDAFGALAPPANGFGQSCYEGLHALADLAHRAGSLHHASMRRLPRDPTPGHAASKTQANAAPVYLAAADGTDFRLIRTC